MEENMKEAIVKATFSLMEKKDMNSISVREIATAAGVNVAAISYYFGGKTDLFFYMMEQYWEDLRQLCLEILNLQLITKEQAKNFCLRFMKKEMMSTGILRSEQIMYQNYAIDQKTQERIELQFKAFGHLVSQCCNQKDEKTQMIKIISLLSALTHPAFWNEIAEKMVGDLETFMKAYVNELVETI